jgi:predicted aldo/keto reductase-like oxidoreductase
MKTMAGTSDSKSGDPFNSDAALKWVLQNNNISSIVSGMSSLEEMQKNLAMIKDLRMTEQELKDLKLASMDKELGLYCLQCKKCIPQCRQHLDVPSIMRSYMYAYGYKNIPQAWHTLASANITADACGNCEKCMVKCTAGFDVKRKISDISRLANVPVDLIGA